MMERQSLTLALSHANGMPMEMDERNRLAALDHAALCHATAAGNELAFELFHDRFQARLYGFLMLLTASNDGLARELAQMTMIRVAHKFRPARTEVESWAWMSAIARNLFLDHCRREERRLRRENGLDHESGIGLPPSLPDISSQLWQAISELESDEKRLLEAFYFREESQAAIAGQLGHSVKAVESKLARTRRKLKSILLKLRQNEK